MFAIPHSLRALPRARPALASWRSRFLMDYTTLPMPALSPTMTTGRIASWKVKEGEKFKVDDVLCEVETDKAVVDFSAVDEGVLAKILIPAGGAPIAVGEPLALVVDDASEVEKAIDEYSKKKPEAGEVRKAAPEAKPKPVAAPNSSAQPQPEPKAASGNKNAHLSPSARSILGADVDVSTIIGSGKRGLITKEDALNYLSSKKTQKSEAKSSEAKQAAAKPSSNIPVAPSREARPPAESYWLPDDRGPYRDIPVTMMRRAIAQRLSECKERVPHAYATIEADIESALETRASLKRLNMPVPSMNDLVVRACALALVDVPALNVRIEGDKLTPNDRVDISVAVATPGGLITPIIENANDKSPLEISAKMKDLAARAKINKLKPHEYQGGSFSVSNLGMLGIDDFTAILNPPQVAILAVGSGKRSLVVPKNAISKKEVPLESLESRSRMAVTLSYDPRAVTPIHAAKFLQAFQAFIEAPSVLFMSGSIKGSTKA